MENKEFEFKGLCVNGFLMLLINLLMLAFSGLSIIEGIITGDGIFFLAGILLFVLWFIHICGFILLEPNEARALLFFGKYRGTFKRTGFFWANPFLTVKKLSLRARNLNADPIKVNDKEGNPILIGLVLVWRLKDTYKCLFEIDSQTMAENPQQVGENLASRMRAFESFVRVQSDAALRQVAGLYSYDSNGELQNDELTLRSGGNEINQQLEAKLNERLAMAGIEVVEARINYLAYAPEIAAVMLRRQQADAIIMAREKIVEGAVSMVKIALDKLSDEQIVNLTDEKKATLVSNLMVVLCADEPAQPIINSGSEQA